MLPPDPFEEIPNSLYAAVFGYASMGSMKLPPKERLNTLSTISGLYLYTNPPPNGTGTPAPKVAETVLRSMNFNLKEENRTAEIDGYEVDNPVWTSEAPFPYHQISSNFEPGSLHSMTKEFLRVNYQDIAETAERTISKICVLNSDELTKGRQTWDPLEERSVPCAQAYSSHCEFLIANGYPNHHTMLELIKYNFDLMNKKEVKTKIVEYSVKKVSKKINGQNVELRRKFKKVKCTRIKGVGVYKHIMDLARSFTSYIKHGERAHLERRAIASTGIILRALFYVGEEFHLALGKRIKGSTISIGGEMKKIKITSLTSECRNDPQAQVAYQATQDATKWNECLSPMGFGLFTKTLFDADVRYELGLPAPTSAELLLGEICMASHFILALKMITLGEGLQGVSEEFHGEIPFKPENLPKFNKRTQEWFSKTIPYLYGNNYMRAPGGMLMGMHNALSTTYGLVSVGYNNPVHSRVYTLRSSDDSMTIYTGPTNRDALLSIVNERINLKKCGINLSEKKTFIYILGYGEYTSWYQDRRLVSQYGAEATRLRPSGMNPPDDFYNIARTTANSLMNLESNPIGAEAKIRIGIHNVRSLYRIVPREVDTDNISNYCRVLADGGTNPWNCTNCHLEETSLKKRKAVTQEERDYFNKIRNPDNPFAGAPTTEANWDKETGKMVLNDVDTPRTVFHYTRRANATVKNVKGSTHADMEKYNAKAIAILQNADPTLLIKVPTNSHASADHVASCITTRASNLNLNEEEIQKLKRVLNILRENTGENDPEDYGAVYYDDDL